MIISAKARVRDQSNGYEAIAEAFARVRRPSIGPNSVVAWAKRLPPGASVLDIGCGNGVPISKALLDEGFTVYGIDASKTLAAQFRMRFPQAVVECSSVQDSTFFNRSFDAVVAWGLMFLLPIELQTIVIGKIGQALKREGHFLFTAPRDACEWTDAMTGLPSVSLGQDKYAEELKRHGFALVGNDTDEGDNYYYFATRL